MKHLITNTIIILSYILFLPTLPFWSVAAVCVGVEGHRMKGALCQRRAALRG